MAALKYLGSHSLGSPFSRVSGGIGLIHTTAHCTTLYYIRKNINNWDVDFVITLHLQAALAVSQYIVLLYGQCMHYVTTCSAR